MQHLDEGTIHAWLDGELPPAERAQAEAHIAECAECAAAVAEARGFVAASSRILTALDSVPGGVLPATSTGSDPVRRAVPRRFMTPRAWMAVAAVLVLSTVTVVATRPRDETAQVQVAAAARDQKEVPASAPPSREEARATKPSAAPQSANAPAPMQSRAAAAGGAAKSVDQTERLKSRLEAERKSTLVRPNFGEPGATAPQASSNRLSVRPAAAPTDSVAAKDLAEKREAEAPVYESLSGQSAVANARSVTITGRVTSEAGAPLASASVTLRGTGIAAVTDADGSYELVVPAARANGQKASLVARLIGYKTAADTIAPADAPITHDFVLAANSLTLGQVVITGEGVASAPGKLGAVTGTDESPVLVSRSTSTEWGDSVVTTIYAVSGGTVTLIEQSPATDAISRQKESANFSDRVMAKARDDARINSITWSDSSGRMRTMRGAVSREELERVRAALFGPKP